MKNNGIAADDRDHAPQLARGRERGKNRGAAVVSVHGTEYATRRTTEPMDTDVLDSAAISTSAPDPEVDLDGGLRRLGYEQFRPGQREAIETLFRSNKLLLVAPTGGGKSLTYQLPASLLGGTTLVVSPLVALMADQVAALTDRGVAATYLAATLDRGELRSRLAGLASSRYRLAYVAPERLGDFRFRELIDRVECPLIAIDEAHCISEWGHDFRPEYLQLHDLLGRLPKARVLACTATATPIVRDEILARLGLGPDTPQLIRGFARPNLVLRARQIASKKARETEVDAALTEAIGAPGKARGTAIVYSPTRRKSEQQAARLAERGYRANHYHAGLDGSEREHVQTRFMSGALDVVVATNAFGMGIDRADVRAVVHLAPPGSVEAYYQEVGRAGRDGERAWGLLLWSAADVPLRRRLLELSPDGMEIDPAVVEHKWNLFLELLRWAEGGACRHDAILRYFGDEAEAMGGCGQCDACTELADDDPVDDAERSIIVQKALSGVARVHRQLGLQAAVKLLHGDSDPRLSRMGLELVPTFGVLRDHPAAWISRLLQRAVTAGWVSFSGGDRPVAILTREGADVMRGRKPARIVLPSKKPPRAVPGARTGRANRAAGIDELDLAGRELFEALRAHRLDVARAEGVPPYVVATDRSLRDIAELRPTSRNELLRAHGVGPAKAERFGDGLIGVVRRHVESR